MSKKTDRAKKLKKSRNMCKNNGYSHALHTKDKPKKVKPKLASQSVLAVGLGQISSPLRAIKSSLASISTKYMKEETK